MVKYRHKHPENSTSSSSTSDSPTRHDLIVKTLKEWSECPLLDPVELGLVGMLYEEAQNGREAFEHARIVAGTQFFPVLLSAINKARSMGIGQYVKSPEVYNKSQLYTKQDIDNQSK